MSNVFDDVLAEHCFVEKAQELLYEYKDHISPFVELCRFIDANPASLSWRSKKKPSVYDSEGLLMLAEKYLKNYYRSDLPKDPTTFPDEIVSIVLEEVYGYSSKECEKIKIEHQHSMSSENCVGNLLERYLYHKLKKSNWVWCCGNFIKAVDFILPVDSGKWKALQIKNRDNSENSSSSAIRDNTEIDKWFRSFSKTGKTNWENLPSSMLGYELSETDFISFVRNYLNKEKEKLGK